ncbi:hypothetical protein B0H13DRAFT_1853950 [Mycena leptocephala]|nr:hypothetical protein B0H13DRAFT_1853950 [Mycena leptocephala]
MREARWYCCRREIASLELIAATPRAGGTDSGVQEFRATGSLVLSPSLSVGLRIYRDTPDSLTLSVCRPAGAAPRSTGRNWYRPAERPSAESSVPRGVGVALLETLEHPGFSGGGRCNVRKPSECLSVVFAGKYGEVYGAALPCVWLRCEMLCGVISGLRYPHSVNIVHGVFGIFDRRLRASVSQQLRARGNNRGGRITQRGGEAQWIHALDGIRQVRL